MAYIAGACTGLAGGFLIAGNLLAAFIWAAFSVVAAVIDMLKDKENV